MAERWKEYSVETVTKTLSTQESLIKLDQLCATFIIFFLLCKQCQTSKNTWSSVKSMMHRSGSNNSKLNDQGITQRLKKWIKQEHNPDNVRMRSSSWGHYLSVKRWSSRGCRPEEPGRRTPRRYRRWPSGRLRLKRSAENPWSTTLWGRPAEGKAPATSLLSVSAKNNVNRFDFQFTSTTEIRWDQISDRVSGKGWCFKHT